MLRLTESGVEVQEFSFRRAIVVPGAPNPLLAPSEVPLSAAKRPALTSGRSRDRASGRLVRVTAILDDPARALPAVLRQTVAQLGECA